MPRTHVVTQGESLASIAKEAGFFEGTLWDLPQNAALRALRKRPSVLAPGDEVFIPDLSRKEASCASGRTHVFKRRGIPATYRLRLLRSGGAPAAGLQYTLTIDGVKKQGTTDEDGCLEEYVPPGAKKGTLAVPAMKLRANVLFGQLDPVDHPSGVQKRLANLGFYKGEPTGYLGNASHAALRAFQRAHGLEDTGECDERTRQALEKAHDER